MANGVPDTREKRAVRPRHRPLIPVLIGVTLGIALDATFEPPVLLWLALALVVAVGSVWGVRRGLHAWGNWTLALLLLVPFGGVYHAARVRYRPSWHLRNLALRGEVSYYVRGTVAGEPEVYYRHSAFGRPGEQPQPYWLVHLRLEALSGDRRQWRKAAGGMAVFVGEGRPALNVGDEVEFFARPRANRRPSNPGERNRALAYERRGSYATASVHSPDAFTVLNRASWHGSLRAAVARLRSYVQRRMEERLPLAEPGSRFVLVSALLFGRRNALSPEQDALLKESDTLHFLAISGLHVGLFCLFTECVFALLGLPVRFRTLLTIALIWLYVLFTGMQVPALRAGLMLSFLLAAPVFGRQRDSLSAFAAAALAILLLSPGQLFAPGFQFTFMAVWAMITIYPQLAQILWPWEDLLARLRAPEERSLWTDVWAWARSYLLLSCVVWVATAPVRVYHFNSLCILAPLLNLLVWPLVLLLLLTCFALAVSILLGGIGLGAIAWLAQFLSGDIETLLRAAAQLPGFGIYLPSPPVWWIGLFYGAMAAWVLRGRLRGGRSIFFVTALLVGATHVGNEAMHRAQRRFSLTLADVGLGQAALLCVPDGQAVLFDAGSAGRTSADTVAEMLWHSRIRRINGIVISHLDSDHCNFAPFLARRFDVDQVILPVSGELPASLSRLRQWFGRQGFRLRRLSGGGTLRGGGLYCEALHPDERFAAEGSLGQNDKSLVLRCKYGGLAVVLASDIEGAGMRRLCKDYGAGLEADILVMPHHGRYHEGLEDFVALVRPALAVVSGREADCDRQTRDILERGGIPLWITETEGAIIVALKQGRASVVGFASGRTLDFELARGRAPVHGGTQDG